MRGFIMSTSGLKQLFLVGFLGLTLVGCSSTPTTEEGGDSGSTAEQTSGTETSSATDSNAGSGSDMAAATNSAGQTAEDLYAALQGKVVNFEFDRSEVQSQFYDVIKMNADYMAMNDSAMVTVKGYCDERGTREYNLALGERRANAVKNALIAEGVSPSRITVISFGEENPVDSAHNEAAWAKNRRAEFSY